MLNTKEENIKSWVVMYAITLLQLYEFILNITHTEFSWKIMNIWTIPHLFPISYILSTISPCVCNISYILSAILSCIYKTNYILSNILSCIYNTSYILSAICHIFIKLTILCQLFPMKIYLNTNLYCNPLHLKIKW